MRLLVRLTAGIAALLLLLLALLATLLPRLVQTEAARERIQSASRSALGRELNYRELDLGLLPPSLLVEEPRLAGAGPDDAAALEARRIALRIALWPLLGGAVVIDSLLVEGAALRLVRTADGVALPLPATPRTRDAQPAAAEWESDAGPVALAIRSLELRDARLALEDRTLRPPVTWMLRDIDLEARGSSLDAPIELEGSVALASGGAIGARGTVTAKADLDLQLEISALALAPLRPYVGAEAALEGLLAGAIRVQGPAAHPAALSADLTIRDARFSLRDIAVSGAVGVQLDVAHALERPSGSFALDASAAELRYGGAFTKPVGMPATVSGRVVADENGALGTDDVRLRIHDLDATGRVRMGPPLLVEIDSASAELDGMQSLVQALAAAPPRGRLRAEKLRFVNEPRALVGVIHLEDLEVTPRNLATPIGVRGALVAQGTELRSRDLDIVAAGQHLAVDLRLLDLFGKLRYAIEAQADGADSNALLTAFASRPDTLYGPLSLRGSFRGAVDPERPFLDALTGSVQFDIDKGRLAGVSLLEATFSKLGALGKLGSLAVNAGQLFSGSQVEKYYGNDFEHIRGNLRVDGPVAHAEPLSLFYSAYGAELAGTLRLTDLALDMKGRLTFYEEIDASIARSVGAEGHQPSRRSIPLASVRGTLDAPEVQLAGNTAGDFATRYARDLYAGRLKGLADSELGKGAGQAIQGALEGLLGGDRRQSAPDPQD